jgi:predicted RNase H-like HicB family nuclease
VQDSTRPYNFEFIGICKDGKRILCHFPKFQFYFRQRGLVIFPRQRHIGVMEIVFTVTQEADGGFVAECLSHDIFTQGDSWEALRANAQEAASAFFFDGPKPDSIRLHLVRDEVFARA